MRRVAVLALWALPVIACGEQKTFASPGKAADALLHALTANDDAALVALFGQEHKSLLVTSDHAADAAKRIEAVEAMRAGRRLVAQGRDRRLLLIGQDAWPLPVPLVR